MKPGVKLQSYPAGDKLRIVLEAEKIGNRAAARKCGVPESCIRRWRQSKWKLQTANKSRRAFRGKKSKYPELENKLAIFMREKRLNACTVSSEMCILKAREIARELGIAPTEFKASKGWLRRFFVRHGLLNSKTTVSNSLKGACIDNFLDFQRYLNQLGEIHCHSLQKIGIAVLTPVYFDVPSDSASNGIDHESMIIPGGGSYESYCMVMLSAMGNGKKLPPYAIFKEEILPDELTSPAALIIKTQDNGWMDSNSILDWIKRVWEPRPGGLLKVRNMLLLDNFPMDLEEPTKQRLMEGKTEALTIPDVMSSLIHPLEDCIQRPFNTNMRKLYTEWTVSTLHEKTSTGKVKGPELTQVCQWISASWEMVPEDLIFESFKECFISDDLDCEAWTCESDDINMSEESSSSDENEN